MPYNRGNLAVVVDLCENPLSDHGVQLHLTPLVQRKSPGLFQQPGRETDLANVVHETAEVYKLLLFLRQTHPPGDVARVDRNGCRMTCRITISRIERRNESGRKREIGFGQPCICLAE